MVAACVAFVFWWGQTGFGAVVTGTWANSTGAGNTSWSSSGNWNSGIIPGTTTTGSANTDVAIFQATATEVTPLLDASRKLGAINIDNSQADYNIDTNSASNILYLSTSGTTPQLLIAGGGATNIDPVIGIAAGTATWKTGATALTLRNGVTVSVGSVAWVLTNSSPVVIQGAFTNSIATTLTLDGSGSVTISGTVQNGTGATTFASNQTYSGTFAITGGNTSTSGSITWRAGTLEAGSNTAFGNVTSIAMGSSLSGALNSSVLTIGAYTVSANISFNANNVNPTITVGGAQTSGTSVYSGTINLGTVSGNTNHAGGLILTSASGGTVVFSNTILGTGTNAAITKTGGGVVVLGGSNTYAGATTIQNGTLSVTSVNGLPSTTMVNMGVAGVSSGTFAYTGTSGTIHNNFNVLGNNGDTIQNGGTGLHTISSTFINDNTNLTLNSGTAGLNVSTLISGSGGLTVTGGAATTLRFANKYAGNTTIYGGGTLISGTNDVLPDTNTSGVTSNSSLTLGNGESSGTNTCDLAGFNQTLSGIFTNSSGSTVNQILSSNGSGGNSTTTGTLTLNIAGATDTFSGSLGGSGGGTNFGLIKTGTGTLVLTGSNTYTGPTVVGAGTLQVNGSLSGGGAVTVGGVLSGTGSVKGAVTVSAGGSTNPGAGGAPGVLTLDLAYNAGSKANFNVSGTNPGNGSPQGHLSGLYYSQIAVTGSANVVNLGIGTATTIGANSATSLSETAAQIQGDGSSNSGVTLKLSFSAADYATLLGSKTNAYQGFGSNSSLDNYFVFTLGDGLVTGRFQTLDINIDGTDFTGTIYYAGANDRFAIDGVGNTIGDVFVNGQEYTISYTGNAAANSTTGGNDIVLTAIPEPGTWGMVLCGFGILISIQKLRGGARWRDGSDVVPAIPEAPPPWNLASKKIQAPFPEATFRNRARIL